MVQDKYTIWSSDIDTDDHLRDFSALNPEMSEDELIDTIYETNNSLLDDERRNLNIQLPREIVLIADIGRWNGRRSGYRVIESGNIKDCLYSGRDEERVSWYVDDIGEFRCDAVHHDGTNKYIYRTLKDDATDEQFETLKNKIYNGIFTDADIDKVTKPIGEQILKIYGIELPQKQHEYER